MAAAIDKAICNTSPMIVGLDVMGTQVFEGWPNSTSLPTVLNNGGFQVTVKPLPISSSETIASPKAVLVKFTPGTVVGTLTSPTVVTFTGTLPASTDPSQPVAILATSGSNITAQVSPTILVDSTFADLDAIATAAAAALTSAGIPAEADGATVVSTGTGTFLDVRVGGSGILAREIRRMCQQFLVTIWAGTETQRDAVWTVLESSLASPLENAPGTSAVATRQFLDMLDGTAARIVLQRDWREDESQADYGLFEQYARYEVTYPVCVFSPAMQIVATRAQITALSVIDLQG